CGPQTFSSGSPGSCASFENTTTQPCSRAWARSSAIGPTIDCARGFASDPSTKSLSMSTTISAFTVVAYPCGSALHDAQRTGSGSARQPLLQREHAAVRPLERGATHLAAPRRELERTDALRADPLPVDQEENVDPGVEGAHRRVRVLRRPRRRQRVRDHDAAEAELPAEQPVD